MTHPTPTTYAAAQAQAIAHLQQTDVRLAEVIAQITLTDLDIQNDIYHTLLDSIVSQQLSVKAATTIYNRFLTLFPNGNAAPEWILQCDTEQLRGVGLSGQKVNYMRNVATFWQENQLDERDWLTTSDDDLINELTQIKGVGKWTVQMILMFKLGRLDVFPTDDLGIRQGMMHLYDLHHLKGKALLEKMHELAAPWQPYRSVACRYLWRFKDAKLMTQ